MNFEFDPRTDVNITGLEWWEVLQRLHWATKVIGPFALIQHPLSKEHALALIGEHILQDGPARGFDLVNGRPMKISFHTKHGQSFVRGVDVYDRHASTPAKKTISALRNEKARQLASR